mgnify:CR=1 FL=1
MVKISGQLPFLYYHPICCTLGSCIHDDVQSFEAFWCVNVNAIYVHGRVDVQILAIPMNLYSNQTRLNHLQMV